MASESKLVLMERRTTHLTPVRSQLPSLHNRCLFCPTKTINKELWVLLHAWFDENPNDMPPCGLHAHYNPRPFEIPKSVLSTLDKRQYDYYVFRIHIKRNGDTIDFCIILLEHGNEQFFVMKRIGRRYKSLYNWLGGDEVEIQPMAEIQFADAPETRMIHRRRRRNAAGKPGHEHQIDLIPSTRCQFINGSSYRPSNLRISSTVNDVFSEAAIFYGKEPCGLLYRVEGEADDLMPCMLKNPEDFEIFRSSVLRQCRSPVNLWPYHY